MTSLLVFGKVGNSYGALHNASVVSLVTLVTITMVAIGMPLLEEGLLLALEYEDGIDHVIHGGVGVIQPRLELIIGNGVKLGHDILY